MKKNKYYRIFTAFIPKRIFLVYSFYFSRLDKALRLGLEFYSRLLFVYLILVFVSLSFVAYQLFKIDKYQERRKEASIERLQYWEKVLSSYQNYPDAYYEVSYYALQLRQKIKATDYITKALFYDPNFNEAKRLRLEILGR